MSFGGWQTTMNARHILHGISILQLFGCDFYLLITTHKLQYCLNFFSIYTKTENKVQLAAVLQYMQNSKPPCIDLCSSLTQGKKLASRQLEKGVFCELRQHLFSGKTTCCAMQIDLQGYFCENSILSHDICPHIDI